MAIGPVAVLLGAGGAGLGGRARRALNDARAAEMALSLAEDVIGIHAGSEPVATLPLYAGMGLLRIVHLPVAPDVDVLPALGAALLHLRPRLVFAGARSEADGAAGQLPFALAASLGWPVLSEISTLALRREEVMATQRLGRGLMRRLGAAMPAMVTVGATGPEPRQVAFAKARRLRIERMEMPAVPVVAFAAPVRLRSAPPPRPALQTRIDLQTAFARASSVDSPTPLSGPEAARQIMAALTDDGFLPPSAHERNTP